MLNCTLPLALLLGNLSSFIDSLFRDLDNAARQCVELLKRCRLLLRRWRRFHNVTYSTGSAQMHAIFQKCGQGRVQKIFVPAESPWPKKAAASGKKESQRGLLDRVGTYAEWRIGVGVKILLDMGTGSDTIPLWLPMKSYLTGIRRSHS